MTEDKRRYKKNEGKRNKRNLERYTARLIKKLQPLRSILCLQGKIYFGKLLY